MTVSSRVRTLVHDRTMEKESTRGSAPRIPAEVRLMAPSMTSMSWPHLFRGSARDAAAQSGRRRCLRRDPAPSSRDERTQRLAQSTAAIASVTVAPHGRAAAADRRRRAQHVDDGVGVPAPVARIVDDPAPPERVTAPRWTTYQTPRQEIIDAIPKERTCPSSSVDQARVRHLVVADAVVAGARRDPMGVADERTSNAHEARTPRMRAEQRVRGDDVEPILGYEPADVVGARVRRSP